MSGQELLVRMRDLSTGGVGVFLLPKNDEPPKVRANERLRVSLRYRDLDELILEGRVRYLPPPAPTRRSGRAFNSRSWRTISKAARTWRC